MNMMMMMVMMVVMMMMMMMMMMMTASWPRVTNVHRRPLAPDNII
jgi:hypothetical protein